MNFLSGIDPNKDQNNNTTYRQAKNSVLNVSTKHPYLVRILPFLNHKPVYRYRQAWVDVYNKKHTKTNPTRLTFSFQKHGDDKLRDLVSKIIGINYNARQNNPSESGDVIQLQYKHPGHPHFNASMREMDAFLAVKIVKGTDGNDHMETMPDSTMPLVRILNVPHSVYSQIFSSLQLKDSSPDHQQWIDVDTKKLFPVDPTNSLKLGWINLKQSFPVYISRKPVQGARYRVDPQPFTELGEVSPDIYKKDKSGKYVYIDDPAWLYAPTSKQDPDWAKIVYQQLSQRLDEYKEKGSNPFAKQVETVKSNTSNDDNARNNQSNDRSDYNHHDDNSINANGTSGSTSSTNSSTDSDRNGNTSTTNIPTQKTNSVSSSLSGRSDKNILSSNSGGNRQKQSRSIQSNDETTSTGNGKGTQSSASSTDTGIPPEAQKIINDIKNKNLK